MDALYRELPLDSNRRNIRLLSVTDEGTQDDLLQCSLVVRPLDNGEEYCAHSYVWGDVGQTVLISVNGLPMMVTENLLEVLNEIPRINDVKGVRTVQYHWIDAICIDQLNVAEKNVQVGRMGEIYKNAVRVVAHLGPATHDSALAMETIQNLGGKLLMLAFAGIETTDIEGYQSEGYRFDDLVNDARRFQGMEEMMKDSIETGAHPTAGTWKYLWQLSRQQGRAEVFWIAVRAQDLDPCMDLSGTFPRQNCLSSMWKPCY